MTYREEIEGGGLSSSCECSRIVTTVNRLLRGVAALLCERPPAALYCRATAVSTRNRGFVEMQGADDRFWGAEGTELFTRKRTDRVALSEPGRG